MSKRVSLGKQRLFASLDHYLGFMKRLASGWRSVPTGEYIIGLAGDRREKFSIQLVTDYISESKEIVTTYVTMVTTIYPESQTNLLDDWLREWQTTQERKA